MSNKLGVAISALSVLVIGGSVYYYNDSIARKGEELQKNTVTTTTTTAIEDKLKQSKENIKISTEIREDKIAIITLENISDRNLSDVVVEANFKNSKITEILIPNVEKGAKKKIEVPLENKINAASIKENEVLSSGFRMLEKYEFSVGDSKGEIVVSTLKSQNKEFYIEKVKTSNLEGNQKDELVEKIESAKSIEDIEKLLKENKIIDEIKLSDEHVTFKEGETELKIERKIVEETTVTTVAEISEEVPNTERQPEVTVYTRAALVTTRATVVSITSQTEPAAHAGNNTLSTSNTAELGTENIRETTASNQE